MKKGIFTLTVLILFTVFLSCGGIPAAKASGGLDLDVAVKEAAVQMETKIPSGTKVAMVSVASPSTAFSEQVLTRLESAIVSDGKLVVVDRANLDKVRAEQGFQLSGEVDDESAKSIGKLLGAGAIVTGSLADLGDVYSLTLKAINIETATVAVSYLADIAKSKRIETLLASGGSATGTGTRTAQTGGNTSAAAAVPSAPAYKIGDKGPAGGIIFYDKGNNSSGWRYLEAAPADAEFKAQFGDVTYHGYSTELGTGKNNTQLIRAHAEQIGELTGAVFRCTRLNINGFSDWFMPSKTELGWMYINLKERGLGDFSSGWYWSSSSGNNSYNMSVQNFSDGSQYYGGPSDNYSVRAIRSF